MVLDSSNGAVTNTRAWLKRQVRLARAFRVAIGYVTVILLALAFAAGVWGLSTEPGRTDFHLIVETFAVAAALTGLFAERVAARVERRHAAIRAVRKELVDNIELVERDPRFELQDARKPEPRIYPRVEVGATDACLAQAALTDDGDAERAAALTQWREQAQTFNRTLGVIELVCYGVSFANHDAAGIIIAADHELQEERTKIVTATQKVLNLV